MKYCDFNGCGNKITKGAYCEEHKRSKEKPVKKSLYDKSNKSFYNSKQWKSMRQFIYERDKGCCKRCGRFVFGKMAQVHHIVKVKSNATLKLEPNNLKLLCPECHAIEENEEQKENVFANYFN
ncbi:endonuclease [Viridibacillus sp. FSL H7-0596]|uniref:HNH endonuclease n=1 Tax=Viridibacillus sp. FSL H7-0596 TaxID=1928923 RepID=UPI00096E336C|nr:HNH endonuclease signature motif containing protein [Viridibacillus sp. FSL H7-0596]OMC81861.1 endonuclease [Viridibacillus sp. FSL H7-0596]